MEKAFAAHARLKARIHAFRLPIQSRLGLFGVGVVYFTVPCLIGYGLLTYTNVVRDKNLGPNRELLIARQKAWKEEERASRPLVMAHPPEPPKVPQTTRSLL